jgi:hypothetical protein
MHDLRTPELRLLYLWVKSDGSFELAIDEIVNEMFNALPISRRGHRIEAILRDTIYINDARM